MKKLLLLLAAAAIIAGGWFTLVREVPPTPLLSANLEVLSESALQGYCTGNMLALQEDGPAAAAACWETYEEIGAQRDVHAVIPAFCRGLIDGGWNGTLAECQNIVARYKLWPIRTGGIADSWDDNYKYPTERSEEQKINTRKDNTRTGDREENSR
jgi:hypothetical protein